MATTTNLLYDPFDPATVGKLEQFEDVVNKPTLVQDLGSQLSKPTGKSKRRFGIWECPLCKNNFRASFSNINKGQKSCGCRKPHDAAMRFTKHKLTNTRLYRIWASMIQRVTNVNHRDSQWYIGNGIRVCNEWRQSFIVFKDWSIKNGYSEKLLIDRIDTNGNYCPENCRWTTKYVNNQNSRIRSDNTSGYRGVSFSKLTGKWRCNCSLNGKNCYLKHHATKEIAAKVYNDFVIKHGLKQPLNIIP